MAVALLERPTETDPLEYDSDTIDRYLKRWDELAGRAENVRSPSAYDVARPAPTRGRFVSGNAMEILADLERAHDTLPSSGLDWLVIQKRKGGGSLGSIARALGRRKEDVCGAYRSGLDRMVQVLNGGGGGYPNR